MSSHRRISTPRTGAATTQFSEVSAKTQTNLDELLEKVLLVADLELEGLKANPNAEASGPIIESRLDVGRGPVATMLVHRGTLRVGDAIVAGDAYGRVKALFDYKGERQESAVPGDPIEILGFDKPPAAGELARVVANDREARDVANRRGERLRREQRAAVRDTTGVSLEGLYEQLQEGEVSDLNLIVRGDVVGSVEAVVSELSKFEHAEVRLNVIAEGVGAITQNDIMLASASDALIVGFNVRPNAEARELAARVRASRSERTTSSTSSPRTSSRRSSASSPPSRPRRRSARPRSGRSSASRGSARSPAAWSPMASSAVTRASE